MKKPYFAERPDLAHKCTGFLFDSETIENYYNKEDLEEMFWISTNFTAQWCLNTIVALEYTKDMMLESKEQYEFEPWTKM